MYLSIALHFTAYSLFSPPQTNVYQGAQKRKIGQFEMFKRKAVVVIPPHHELRKRTSRRCEETGSPLPLSVINAMKGGCGLVA